MENEKKTTKNKIPSTVPIRVNKESAKILRLMLRKLNKKDYGRKVRSADVINKALSLLTEKHFVALQESTMSNKDKIDRQYKQYCSQNGSISLDDFFGKLMNGELAANSNVLKDDLKNSTN